jgi:hypothetical protein
MQKCYNLNQLCSMTLTEFSKVCDTYGIPWLNRARVAVAREVLKSQKQQNGKEENRAKKKSR